ncbi:MAG: endonuclease/exonuclease/phosphatase family protein [Planctomycetota bacterium]
MHHGDIDANTAKGLKELQKRIAACKIPSSKIDETLLLATWNIREFGKKRRLKISLHLIAEIIGMFDLVTIVEVRDDVRDLAEVLTFLGPDWKVVFSDYIQDAGGNRERVAFVYDERAVRFTGLASHAFRPRQKVGTEYVDTISWWRPPYMGSFQSGNFDFVVLGAHIRWGDSEAEREGELQKLADWIHDRVDEKYIYEKDIIVLGDFNIPSLKSKLYQAVSSTGLMMPSSLAGIPGSNLAKDKRYDQILHLPHFKELFSHQGGVLDFYGTSHKALMPGTSLTKDKFTYQISDHLPLWVLINTDDDGLKLDQILNAKGK